MTLDFTAGHRIIVVDGIQRSLWGPFRSPNDLPDVLDDFRAYIDTVAPRTTPFFVIDFGSRIDVISERRNRKDRRSLPGRERRQEDRDATNHRAAVILEGRTKADAAARERAHMAFFIGFGVGMIAMYFFVKWAAS